jgi:hypothetical protein
MATTPQSNPAALLYDGKSSADKPVRNEATPAAAMAELLYGQTDGDLSPAERAAYTQHEEDMRVVLGWTADEGKALVSQVHRAAASAGISQYDQVTRRLLDAIVARERAEVRGTERPDASTYQAQKEEIRATLRATFPQDDVNDLIDRADRYLQTRAPKLKDIIVRAGAECDPMVVMRLVELVHSEGFR